MSEYYDVYFTTFSPDSMNKLERVHITSYTLQGMRILSLDETTFGLVISALKANDNPNGKFIAKLVTSSKAVFAVMVIDVHDGPVIRLHYGAYLAIRKKVIWGRKVADSHVEVVEYVRKLNPMYTWSEAFTIYKVVNAIVIRW